VVVLCCSWELWRQPCLVRVPRRDITWSIWYEYNSLMPIQYGSLTRSFHSGSHKSQVAVQPTLLFQVTRRPSSWKQFSIVTAAVLRGLETS
jgi:hypothetical protein